MEFMARGSRGIARKLASPTKRGVEIRSQLKRLSPNAMTIGARTNVANSTTLGARNATSQPQWGRVRWPAANRAGCSALAALAGRISTDIWLCMTLLGNERGAGRERAGTGIRRNW